MQVTLIEHNFFEKGSKGKWDWREWVSDSSNRGRHVYFKWVGCSLTTILIKITVLDYSIVNNEGQLEDKKWDDVKGMTKRMVDVGCCSNELFMYYWWMNIVV